MGTWHTDKDRLKKILTKPIKNKDSIDKLGDGLGDDEFFDFFWTKVCVAKTCSTSEVPIPKAKAPNAP